MELEPKAFNLIELLEEICLLFDAKAEVAGLRFESEIAPDLPAYIKTDPNKIRQVLINLLGNAAKFTHEGGFALRVRSKPLDEDPGLVGLQFEIEDSGPGIPKQQLERIFDPFSQAGHSSDSTRGTGLGLAITRNILQLMGDDIRVESEIGKGSLFQVELAVPLAQADDVSVPKTIMSAALRLATDQPKWRILVVEDIFENRLLLATLLMQAGFVVIEAENGEQAIELFKQYRPHFIWMDVRMPVMDGIEATAQIRALPAGKEVKIVALTASAFKEQRKTILNAGCDDIIHKPFRAHDIFNVIKQQLGVDYTYDKTEAGSVTEPKPILNTSDENKGGDALSFERLQGARILLVEDNDINQELFLNLIEKYETDVSIANDGQEALELLMQKEFDVILMDCEMPVMDGYKTTCKIREQEKFKDLPIIALTSHSMNEVWEKLQEVGMNDFIAKPYDPDVMLSTLAEWLASSVLSHTNA